MAKILIKEKLKEKEIGDGKFETLSQEYSIVETFEQKTTYTLEYINEQIALHEHKVQEWKDLKKEFEKLI